MPPISRPFPRFVADAAAEARPYGRWAERLAEAFMAACEQHVAEAGSPPDVEAIRWFPERSWGGRTYVPATARAAGAAVPTGEAADASAAVEYYGWVSFVRGGEGEEPAELDAGADFTDVTADENPDWEIDLNDAVIAPWRAEGERGGDLTLVWGLPLVRGAIAATAELDGEVVDQTPVDEGRFTLVAVDAVTGFGDEELLLEVRLWDRQLRKVAAESLYA